MPSVPGKPQRKSVGSVGNTSFGGAKPRVKVSKPASKSARPFSSPSKSSVGYQRKSVGINPGNHNINRSAGDAKQPHNNSKSGGSRGMSRLQRKGVD